LQNKIHAHSHRKYAQNSNNTTLEFLSKFFLILHVSSVQQHQLITLHLFTYANSKTNDYIL